MAGVKLNSTIPMTRTSEFVYCVKFDLVQLLGKPEDSQAKYSYSEELNLSAFEDDSEEAGNAAIVKRQK